MVRDEQAGDPAPNDQIKRRVAAQIESHRDVRQWNGLSVLLPCQQTMLARAAKDKEHATSEKGDQPYAMQQLTTPKRRYGSGTSFSAFWPMSASLIGRLGSSTFRLSTTAELMSLAGSRFSSESAPRPFHHGVRRRGGTIYTAALPSE
jgi:hypothetical protein